jgi:hypothetical protein
MDVPSGLVHLPEGGAAVSVTRLSILEVHVSSRRRVHTPPQQYLVTMSWSGRSRVRARACACVHAVRLGDALQQHPGRQHF